jgi:hypothetical protein
MKKNIKVYGKPTYTDEEEILLINEATDKYNTSKNNGLLSEESKAIWLYFLKLNHLYSIFKNEDVLKILDIEYVTLARVYLESFCYFRILFTNKDALEIIKKINDEHWIKYANHALSLDYNSEYYSQVKESAKERKNHDAPKINIENIIHDALNNNRYGYLFYRSASSIVHGNITGLQYILLDEKNLASKKILLTDSKKIVLGLHHWALSFIQQHKF